MEPNPPFGYTVLIFSFLHVALKVIISLFHFKR